VINASIKAVQRQPQHMQLNDEDSEAVIQKLLAAAPSVESQVEQRAFEEQVWSLLQNLSPRQRSVIVERYYLGMTEAEMAERSGRSKGTVKWLLHAARERLRDLLAERNDR
jgi:RNA polymerase sigma-70 factor (ECF subfamily)